MRAPTERIRDTVVRLAAGELDRTVPHTDYPNEIGDLARSIDVLSSSGGALRTIIPLSRWASQVTAGRDLAILCSAA